MKYRLSLFGSMILLFFASLSSINGQIVEIEAGVKVTNLPPSTPPYDLVTYNPDSTLGSTPTTALFKRLDFDRNNSNSYSFTDANGALHVLDVSNVTISHGGANGVNPNTHIAFVPGNSGTDSYLLLNTEGTSGACTVLHVEDDIPRKGMYFASDNGNNWSFVWGNANTQTFIIAFEDNTGHVLGTNASYALICF